MAGSEKLEAIARIMEAYDAVVELQLRKHVSEEELARLERAELLLDQVQRRLIEAQTTRAIGAIRKEAVQLKRLAEEMKRAGSTLRRVARQVARAAEAARLVTTILEAAAKLAKL